MNHHPRDVVDATRAKATALQSFERKILAAFLLGIFTIFTLLAFSTHTVRTQERDVRLVHDLVTRLTLMEDMEQTLLYAETSSRAYALTGVQSYLEEFSDARMDIDRLVQELSRAEFVVALQAQRAERLVELVRTRTQLAEELVRLRRDGGIESARDLVATGRGKTIMDHIRKVTLAFDTEQRQLIRDAGARNLYLAREMQLLLSGFALLNVVIMIAAFVIVRREWSGRDEATRRLRHAMEEISLLNNLSASLQSCSSIAEARDLLQHFMERLFPDYYGALYVMRASRGVLETKATWGAISELDEIMDQSECWALRRGQIHEYSPAGNNLPCAHVKTRSGAYMCVPMMAEGEGIGVLHIQAPPSTTAATGLDTNVRKRAELLTLQIGPAIASVTLRELLRQQSIRDGLTGLYNRRYLEETAARELLRARRANGSAALIMVDVDHFKQYNDNHGHQAGDVALQEFASLLKDGVRGDDIACRYGGEEFAIVLPGASVDKATERAESLRQGTMSLQVRNRGETLPGITASFGIAVFPSSGDRWEELLRAADSALYRAKREGRNRVVVASGPDAAPADGASKARSDNPD